MLLQPDTLDGGAYAITYTTTYSAPAYPTPSQPPPSGLTVTTGPTPVAPAYNPGYVPLPGGIISEGPGFAPSTPPTPANVPAAPDTSMLTNQTYQCGGRCGGTPLPSPGAAGATTVTAAGGSQFAGIPWWVWLVMALLVVLVLAKR